MSIWQVEPERRAELMDDPALPAGDHLAALDALATINAVSLTARQLARAVLRIAAATDVDRPLRIVDVACGGGDLSIALAGLVAARLAARRRSEGGPVVQLLGVDASGRAVARARQVAARRRPQTAVVDFVERDVVAEGCPPCDVAVSSLFLHHLDDPAAEAVLRSMAGAAALGGVVSDLVRSRAGLVLAILGTRLLARSSVARTDGPLSVRAARTPLEYRGLADRAGLPQASVRRCWPERVLVTWKAAEPVAGVVAGMACA